MLQRWVVRVGRLVLIGGLALTVFFMGSSITSAQAGAQKSLTVQGLWRNGDTTMRITVNKSQVKGVFEEVGQLARELGFSAREEILTGTLRDSLIHGEQTIRYGTTQSCFRERGRKVPLMARMTPDGQVLAIHFYNLRVDANCQDTGVYEVTETLWQLVPGR